MGADCRLGIYLFLLRAISMIKVMVDIVEWFRIRNSSGIGCICGVLRYTAGRDGLYRIDIFASNVYRLGFIHIEIKNKKEYSMYQDCKA